ncbi:hypothetical protein [uncultured Pelagimonas sp.]|uniref:hypothetical protein n=1 Tax=uncultured Pelagimonas sp. TaxID=1618102 RepID=UPI00261BC230|nr:hypothetical protein [uncultured Pelagimonas sp.]
MKPALITGAFLTTSLVALLISSVVVGFLNDSINGVGSLSETLAVGVAVAIRALPFWMLLAFPIFAALRAFAVWKSKESLLVFGAIGALITVVLLLPINLTLALSQTSLDWFGTVIVVLSGVASGCLQWWLEQKWFVIEPRYI